MLTTPLYIASGTTPFGAMTGTLFPKVPYQLPEIQVGIGVNSGTVSADFNHLISALIDVRAQEISGTWRGMMTSSADPAPTGMYSYFWSKSDNTLHFKINVTDIQLVTGTGSFNQVAKWLGTAGLTGSSISDDGTNVTVSASLAIQSGKSIYLGNVADSNYPTLQLATAQNGTATVLRVAGNSFLEAGNINAYNYVSLNLGGVLYEMMAGGIHYFNNGQVFNWSTTNSAIGVADIAMGRGAANTLSLSGNLAVTGSLFQHQNIQNFIGNNSGSYQIQGQSVHAFDFNYSDSGFKLSGTCEFLPAASSINGVIAGGGMYVYNSNRTGFSGLYTSYLVAENNLTAWNSSNGRANVTMARGDGLRLSTDAPTIGWSATGDSAAAQDITLTKIASSQLALLGNLYFSGSVAVTASKPTANYNVAQTDCYIGLSGSTITGTLPAAATTAVGKIYFVKNENLAGVAAAQNMIKPGAGDRIDGITAGTGLTLSSSQGLILYCSDPTNWRVLARV